MDDENEIINFLNECINIKMSSETIDNLKWNFGHFSRVPNISNYDDLTINQYIIYYKIYRLEKLGIITIEIKNDLISLYDRYLSIKKEIGSEAYKEMIIDGYKSDKMSDLQSIHKSIKEKLLYYNLNDNIFNLQEMIDNQIIVAVKNGEKNKLKVLKS